ncbi:MAG: hypothetical protein QRY74_03690 [Chlamydia sp.]
MHNTQNITSSAEEKDPEMQLREMLISMEQALSHGLKNHFPSFFTARKRALLLFKESIFSSSGAELWNTYKALCIDARSARTQMYEESLSISEQILITIQSIQKSILADPKKVVDRIEIEELYESTTLRKKRELYTDIQNELSYLHAFTSQLSSLKKELVQAILPLKAKNRLFQQISLVGDHLFPRRKRRIQDISELFDRDVALFLEKQNPLDQKSTQELFEIREEVKRLQNIAKIITLNADIFSATRTKLSECWDYIRSIVQARKKGEESQKSQMQGAKEGFLAEIGQLKSEFKEGKRVDKEIKLALKKIQAKMRSTPLRYEDVLLLKGDISLLEKMVTEQIEHKKKGKIEEFESELRALTEKYQLHLDIDLSIEALQECQTFFKVYQERLHRLGLAQNELSPLSLHVSEIGHLISKKYQKIAFQETSHSNRAFEALIFERDGMKRDLDLLKKNRSRTGNDIVKALELDEEMRVLKEKMQEIHNTIRKIEERDEKAFSI